MEICICKNWKFCKQKKYSIKSDSVKFYSVKSDSVKFYSVKSDSVNFYSVKSFSVKYVSVNSVLSSRILSNPEELSMMVDSCSQTLLS